jgi:hypothetical protein
MMATQEFVVPKSIPMTSPTSVLFHLVTRDETLEPPPTKGGVLYCVVALAMEDVKPRRRPSWSAMIQV